LTINKRRYFIRFWCQIEEIPGGEFEDTLFPVVVAKRQLFEIEMEIKSDPLIDRTSQKLYCLMKKGFLMRSKIVRHLKIERWSTERIAAFQMTICSVSGACIEGKTFDHFFGTFLKGMSERSAYGK
jgi:hypothetical protein